MAWSKLNIAIGVAAVAIAAVEWNQISTAKQKVIELQEQLQHETQLNRAQQAEAAKLDEQNSALKKQLQSTARETARARNRNSMAQPAAANAGAKRSNLADMLKDPAMMKFMQDQAAKEIKKQYAPLAKKLNLTPEQADKFYQVLTDNKMSTLAQKSDVVAAGGNTAALEKIVADAQKETDASLQALLGDAGFAQYQAYQSGVEDRVLLERMNDDFADNPLTEDQQQRLLQAMQAARQAVANNTSAIGFSVTDTSALMEQKLQQQEAINQEVLQQAAAFLTPAQLQTLGSSQSNIINLTTAGYAMARKMFGAQSNGAAASGQ